MADAPDTDAAAAHAAWARARFDEMDPQAQEQVKAIGRRLRDKGDPHYKSNAVALMHAQDVARTSAEADADLQEPSTSEKIGGFAAGLGEHLTGSPMGLLNTISEKLTGTGLGAPEKSGV